MKKKIMNCPSENKFTIILSRKTYRKTTSKQKKEQIRAESII